MRYDHSRKSRDYIEFLNELPHKIKLELAMKIHQTMYESVKFFKDRPRSFIAWIGTVLKPMNVSEHEYIYQEVEEITESKSHLISNC